MELPRNPQGWRPGVPNILLVERIGTTNTFSFRPTGPYFAMLRASAGGVDSDLVNAVVGTGPPAALKFDLAPGPGLLSGVPFFVSLWTVDADGFSTRSEAVVTASIASGTGTLSGTTTGVSRSYQTSFDSLIIRGTGVHTLRFTSPGLADLVATDQRQRRSVTERLHVQCTSSPLLEANPATTSIRCTRLHDGAQTRTRWRGIGRGVAINGHASPAYTRRRKWSQ